MQSSYSSIVLSRSVLSCIPALEANVVLSGRAVYANSCIAAGVSSGRVVTLMIVLCYSRTWLSRANFSELICIPYSIHVGLALAMCLSFRFTL